MKKLLFYTLVCLLLVSINGHSTFAQDNALTIIGHPDSAPAELTQSQLMSILKGERLRWDNGTNVRVALMKTNTSLGAETCERIYNMSGNELNKYFLALVFQGKAKAPTFFNSVSELEEYVAQTPGAIGVTNSTSNSQIKIISVDGKTQL